MVLDAAPISRWPPRRGGAEAVEVALREERIHLAVLDVAMPRMTGLQAAAELSQRRPEPKLLMLSMHESEQYLFEALRAGASGYVLKTAADPRSRRSSAGCNAWRAISLSGGRLGADPRLPGAKGDSGRSSISPASSRCSS